MKPGFPRYMISAQPFHNVCVGLWNNFDVGDNNYDQQQDKDKLKNTSESTPKTQISTRENDVLLLLCQGLSVTEIADKLFLSAKTIETHRSALLKKTNTKNTINLILFAFKNNLAALR